MKDAAHHGERLLARIEGADAVRPHLWWLGRSGFAIKHFDIVFYLNPLLGAGAVMEAALVRHADMILSTHASPLHMHGATLLAMLQSSVKAKVVLPKSAAAHAFELGIPYERMTTTDAGLRVEYFKNGMYARIYAVPSAHPDLDYTPLGGYPYLGYLVRCGDVTVYYAGGCQPYDTLAERLRPYNVTVAILPVSGSGNFTVEQASQLAEEIGAAWLIPMPGVEGDDSAARFLDHMLFHRPRQRFKIFACGEGWQVPAPIAEP